MSCPVNNLGDLKLWNDLWRQFDDMLVEASARPCNEYRTSWPFCPSCNGGRLVFHTGGGGTRDAITCKDCSFGIGTLPTREEAELLLKIRAEWDNFLNGKWVLTTSKPDVAGRYIADYGDGLQDVSMWVVPNGCVTNYCSDSIITTNWESFKQMSKIHSYWSHPVPTLPKSPIITNFDADMLVDDLNNED